jgi:predicted ATPase
MPTALWDDSRGAFTYLSSDRLGPKNNSLVQSAPKDLLKLGHKGEYVGDILNQCERDKILDELQHPNASGQRFAKQVETWLATFVPGVEIRVQRSLGSDLVSLEFRKGNISSEWERPSNIGYGVSYCLPIIVACLMAEEDSIVLIESPEAHLHPSAQSAMGSFLARVAAAGIQLFVETHSDHVLNGIRKAALDEAHPLSREEVVIHHLFIDDGTTHKEEIRITEDGNLSSRPRSFFDQAEHDIAAIVKSRFPSKK